jgi:sortase (surface protein transpeptidase)
VARWRSAHGHAVHSHRVAVSFVAAGLVVCCAGLAGVVAASRMGHGPVPLGATPLVAVPAGEQVAPSDQASQRQVARPTELVIPSIGVRTRLIRLGRTAAGTLQVPATTAVAGWYDGSPRPGQIGSSVIAGHVDSYQGPGVFFRLRALRPGAAIYVRRADGTIVVFRVAAVHLYRKDRFPTATVYGAVPQAGLRLITCGGTFDHSLGSYLSNVVVYAVARSPRSSGQARAARRGPGQVSSRASGRRERRGRPAADRS